MTELLGARAASPTSAPSTTASSSSPTASTPSSTLRTSPGLKIRIPGGDFFMDFYTAYGASPQAMSWSEVFTALQQGTIDGHDNSISTIVSNNVQEIQPYMTVSRHTYEAFTCMANTANFTTKLSEEDQAARPRLRRGRPARRSTLRSSPRKKSSSPSARRRTASSSTASPMRTSRPGVPSSPTSSRSTRASTARPPAPLSASSKP